jgi:hypothetical protein
MYLTLQQITELCEASLREFIELSIPEGLYLDYKAALSGKSDKDAKREFLKDTTAFANAAGGHLIIGVKEPSEGLSIEDQIVGLDNSKILAADLERLASTSIDPRIPGLRIVAVPLANGKSCVVAHIPPSLGRPHMVTHEGHRSFYVRHTESSSWMSTHEIREAVLSTASAEAWARQFVERRLGEIRSNLVDQKPAFFLQAMPMISPEIPWDVLSKPFEDAIRGSSRRNKFKSMNLESGIALRPTIDGVLSRDRRDRPNWELEVYRTGYVSLLYRDIQFESPRNGESGYYVHSGYCDLFQAFCHLLKELLEVSKTDVPFLMMCNLVNAEGTRLWVKEHRSFMGVPEREPYKKNEIGWPVHIKVTGADPMLIAKDWGRELFNAFGLREVVE